MSDDPRLSKRVTADELEAELQADPLFHKAAPEPEDRVIVRFFNRRDRSGKKDD